MKKILYILAVSFLLFATGCGTGKEIGGNNVTRTDVVLQNNNFEVLGYVSGECTQKYWFGVGEMSKESLGQAAMAEMYKNADLKGKEGDANTYSNAISNVNVTYKTKHRLIYTETTATATGTLIRFRGYW